MESMGHVDPTIEILKRISKRESLRELDVSKGVRDQHGQYHVGGNHDYKYGNLIEKRTYYER